MSSFRLMLQMLTIAGVVAYASCSTAAPRTAGKAKLQQSAVNWKKNLTAAHQQAKQTNKPILILFEASWCHYCKKLDTQTISHPKMASYINKTFIPVRLDLDRDKRIAKILGVKKIPCTIVLTPEGDMLSKQVGFEKPVTYYDKIAKARELQDKVHQVKYSRFAR